MWAIALVSVWLVVYCVLFFRLDLPNNSHVNRTSFWLDVPDFLYYSVVQHPDATPSSWSNLSERLPLIATGLWILGGAWGIGSLLLRTLRIQTRLKLERVFFATTLGLSFVSLMTLGCGLLAQKLPVAMSKGVLGSVLAGAAVVEACLICVQSRQRRANESTKAEANSKTKTNSRRRFSDVLISGQIPYGVLCRGLLVLVISLFFLSMMFGALLPSVDFDVKEYHLQGPKEHLQNGYISFLPHNVYTSFPFLTEMLTLLGMVLHGSWFEGALVGKFVLMAFAPLTTLGIFVVTRRFFGSQMAWTSALIHATTPWTYRISIIAYAEGGITCFLFATLAAVLFRADSRNDPAFPKAPAVGWTILCGLLAGSAMACKYPGVLSVVLPLGFTMLIWDFRVTSAAAKTRLLAFIKTGLWYSLGVLVAVGPWLLKNTFETGNPVYPLLHSVFGGIDWTPTLEANWKAAHGPPHYQISDLFVKFHDVTVKSDWLSPLLFSLAPLAFIGRKNRKLIFGMWVYTAFLFFLWWIFTHRIDRFWIPLIPIVSILAGVGVWWSVQKPWQYVAASFIGLSVVFNLGFVASPLCGLNSWLAKLDDVKLATQGTAPGIRHLNALHLPDSSKVLSVGEAEVFDAEFSIVYNTVFDVSIFEAWCSENKAGVSPANQRMLPPSQIKAQLKSAGITHILVNWQEILRYRETYGYSEFVTPDRFESLQQAGVLGPPQNLGMIDSSKFSDTLNQIVDTWPSRMRVVHEGQTHIISTQLYIVEN